MRRLLSLAFFALACGGRLGLRSPADVLRRGEGATLTVLAELQELTREPPRVVHPRRQPAPLAPGMSIEALPAPVYDGFGRPIVGKDGRPASTTSTTTTTASPLVAQVRPAEPEPTESEDPCVTTMKTFGRVYPDTKEEQVRCLKRQLDDTLGVERGGYRSRIKREGVNVARKAERWDDWEEDPENYTKPEESYINDQALQEAIRDARNQGGNAYKDLLPSPSAAAAAAAAAASPAPSPGAGGPFALRPGESQEDRLKRLMREGRSVSRHQYEGKSTNRTGPDLLAQVPGHPSIDGWFGLVKRSAAKRNPASEGSGGADEEGGALDTEPGKPEQASSSSSLSPGSGGNATHGDRPIDLLWLHHTKEPPDRPKRKIELPDGRSDEEKWADRKALPPPAPDGNSPEVPT